MSKLSKLFLILITLFVIRYSLFVNEVYAVCPVCTVAVGAGLGLSRWLGIDDAVSSVWIGGLILSSSFWLIDWIDKKRKSSLTTNHSPSHRLFGAGGQLLTIFSMYLFVLVPLWYGKIIGHPYNTIMGVDKIIFGTAIGSLMFLFGMWMDKKIRKLKGRQLFQYQKVVFPVLSLLIASLVVYFWGGLLY